MAEYTQESLRYLSLRLMAGDRMDYEECRELIAACSALLAERDSLRTELAQQRLDALSPTELAAEVAKVRNVVLSSDPLSQAILDGCQCPPVKLAQ